jgi:hypothetical protein
VFIAFLLFGFWKASAASWGFFRLLQTHSLIPLFLVLPVDFPDHPASAPVDSQHPPCEMPRQHVPLVDAVVERPAHAGMVMADVFWHFLCLFFQGASPSPVRADGASWCKT